MTKKHYITAFILFSCSLLLACGSKNQYVDLPGNTSIEILTASYDKEPSNTTEDERGLGTRENSSQPTM